jgi:hypothetical protein
MKMEKNAIISEFERLEAQLWDVESNISKAGVRRHNRAMDKLRSLPEKLCKEDPVLAERVFDELLSHDDEMLRLDAVVNALRNNICVAKAEQVLTILTKSKKRGVSSEAFMVLHVWRGDIPGQVL